MKKSVRDFSYMFSANSIVKILGIVSVVVFTRLLEKNEIALLAIFPLLSRLSMVMFSLGVLPCLLKDIPSMLRKNEKELAYGMIKTSLRMVVPGVLLFSFLCYFFSDLIAEKIFHDPSLGTHLALLTLGIFFNGLCELMSYIYWSLSRYKQESKRIAVIGIIRVILGVVLVYFYGVYGLILSLNITAIANFFMFTYNLKDIWLAHSKPYPFKHILQQSWPFYLESYLMYLRAEGDQLIIATFLGIETLAIYFIARKPFDILISITRPIEKILTTSLAEFKEDSELMSAKMINILRFNASILLPLILITVSITPTFITLIAGPGYEASVVPSMILLLTLFANFYWKTTFAKAIFLLKPPVTRFVITLIETVILLLLLLLLGKLYELNGIVTGRLLASCATGIIAYYFIQKFLKLSYDLKNVILVNLSAISMAGTILTAQYLSENLFVFLSSIIAGICLFFLLISLLVSEFFYKQINNYLPINIKDPVRSLRQLLH